MIGNWKKNKVFQNFIEQQLHALYFFAPKMVEDLSQPKLGSLLCTNQRTDVNHMVKMAFGDLIDWPVHVHFGERSGKP